MTAVIIAGGQSRRMKTDKAFVEVGGKRLIERVLSVITPLFSEILINSNKPDAYKEWGLPVIQDIFMGKGALGGIYTGLVHTKANYVFCVACDMPALNPDLIRFMQQQVDGCDALIPKTPDGIHPLHTMYSKQCYKVIEELLQRDKLKISDVFSRIRSKYLTDQQIRQFDPHFESFLNINTLEDLQIARKKYQEKGEIL
jgi:molybdopterin-guanine dinucleotide biosynthesis protein A